MEGKPTYTFQYEVSQGMKMRFNKAVSDEKYVLSLKAKLAQCIYWRNDQEESFCIIKQAEWNARAFYDGDFYEHDQEEHLTLTLKKYGYNDFFVVPFVGSFDFYQKVFDTLCTQSRPEAIKELSIYGFYYWHIYYVGEPNLLILLAHQQDFMIVMGEHKIFDEICGYFSPETWISVEEMANSDKIHPRLRLIYANLIANINHIYASAKPGDILTIDLV
jgi:hypothetical protein